LCENLLLHQLVSRFQIARIQGWLDKGQDASARVPGGRNRFFVGAKFRVGSGSNLIGLVFSFCVQANEVKLALNGGTAWNCAAFLEVYVPVNRWLK